MNKLSHTKLSQFPEEIAHRLLERWEPQRGGALAYPKRKDMACSLTRLMLLLQSVEWLQQLH